MSAIKPGRQRQLYQAMASGVQVGIARQFLLVFAVCQAIQEQPLIP